MSLRIARFKTQLPLFHRPHIPSFNLLKTVPRFTKPVVAIMSTTTAPSSTSPDLTPFTRNALFDMSNTTAIVTGGATGIGLMITQALLANGAKRVYITGRRQEKLDRAVQLYNAEKTSGGKQGEGQLVALKGDVTNKDNVLELVKEVEKREPGGIQLLVNNAGVARDDATMFTNDNPPPDMSDPIAVSKHFLRSDPASWDATFRTNVTAYYFMSIAFLPLLAKGNKSSTTASTSGAACASSSVVNFSSISGALKSASGGQPAYACSKAAATHLSRVLATTFKDTGVRCNTIAPGIFPSEMTTGKSGEDNKSKMERKIGNPMGRAGAETDMAASVLLLAGPGGAFYNHQILYPDGGSTLASPAVNN